MRHIAAVAVAVLFLAGCASNNSQQPPPPSPLWEIPILEHGLDAAKAESAIMCRSDDECSKMWALAKAFITEHGDAKLDLVSDTLIATKTLGIKPFVGLSAAKTPSAGGTWRINLLVNCPYLKDSDSFLWHLDYRICARRATTLYWAFPVYISSKMQSAAKQ
jgi:hypothetical protein